MLNLKLFIDEDDKSIRFRIYGNLFIVIFDLEFLGLVF